ncbi:MAG: adenosylmethionine decarboxylase [Thermoprotei archaeon]|nr:MAG: adenosylmethionine decarboxylase [Thermoprotei archaeon]RLF20935.1 MAG: adenosylmethionine decarboxylase [Thermoprotei archaeon]
MRGARELGRHIIAEFIGCPREILDDVELLRNLLIEAANRAGSQVVTETFFKFRPQGVSGVVVIKESHLSVHTWPEYGYAAIDIFTCGSNVDPWKAYGFLRERLKPSHVSVIEVRRGVDVGGKQRQ